MQLRVVLISFLSITYLISVAQDAKTLVKIATDKLATTNVEMLMNIEEKDSKGRSKHKTFELLLGQIDESKKTKIAMKKPERATGVTIVISDAQSANGVIEVYTPSNNKLRKMKATADNMKLVGFDFFMADFEEHQTENVNYEFLETVEKNNELCYAIKASGKTDADWAKLYIRKASETIVSIEMYNSNNQLISETTLSDYKAINGSNGKLYPMQIITSDLLKKKQNTIHILEIKSLTSIDPDTFELDKLVDSSTSE